MATIADLEKLSLPQLKNLASAKTQYGQAKTAKEKATASALGKDIYKEAGLSNVGASGIGTLQDVQSAITKRETAKAQPTKQTIQQQMVDVAKQAKIKALKDKFNTVAQRSAQEQQALTDTFRQQESRIGVQDVMSRAAGEKARAVGGLGQSGAIGQSDIAQNVITQGALGASRAQEQNLRANIEQRLSEAQQAMASGIATAETEATLTGLQNQLDTMNAQEAQAIEQAQIQSERDFTLLRDEIAQMNTENTLRLRNDLEQQNTLLDAQIQQARDQSMFAQEQALIEQKNQNALKIQAIDQANALQLQSARTESSKALMDYEAELSDAVSSYTDVPKEIISGLETTYTYTNPNTRQTEIDKENMLNAVVRLYETGQITEEQGERLDALYGLSDKEPITLNDVISKAYSFIKGE